jgi:nucleoside permease NupC
MMLKLLAFPFVWTAKVIVLLVVLTVAGIVIPPAMILAMVFYPVAWYLGIEHEAFDELIGGVFDYLVDIVFWPAERVWGR